MRNKHFTDSIAGYHKKALIFSIFDAVNMFILELSSCVHNIVHHFLCVCVMQAAGEDDRKKRKKLKTRRPRANGDADTSTKKMVKRIKVRTFLSYFLSYKQFLKISKGLVIMIFMVFVYLSNLYLCFFLPVLYGVPSKDVVYYKVSIYAFPCM